MKRKGRERERWLKRVREKRGIEREGRERE